MPMNLELEQLTIVHTQTRPPCLPGTTWIRARAHPWRGPPRPAPAQSPSPGQWMGLRTDNGTVETMRCLTLLNRNIDLQGICCESTLLFEY